MLQDQRKHATYSPSSSHRWTKCSASLEFPTSEEETDASNEGTTAHLLIQKCWEHGFVPALCAGIHLHDRIVDDEMILGAEMWLRQVASVVRSMPEGCNVYTEVTLGEGQFFGTADMILDGGDHVVIMDFKYGHMPVEAEQNTQLLCYAALFLLQHPDRAPNFTLVIVQPRNGGVKEWKVSSGEVMKFYDEQVEPVLLRSENSYCPGPHCNYCPGMLQCPALYQLALTKDPNQMTPEKAAEVLSCAKVLKKYIDKVEEYAHQMLESGEVIPGFKLVEKRGVRRWTASEEAILRAARRNGIKKSQMYRKVMLTPSQAESMLFDDVKTLSAYESSGTTVVPINDKRIGIDLESVRREF